MHFSALYKTEIIYIILTVFLSTMVMTWLGYRLGTYLNKVSAFAKKDSGVIASGLFGLLAFLLGFTFSMSSARLEKSRAIIAEEANCIGTAILRCDLYGQPDRTSLRTDFRDYLEARISYYSKGADPEQIAISNAAADAAGKKLWDKVSTLSQDPKLFVASAQMIPAMNKMFDIVTTRNVNSQSMVPDQILYMLFILTIFNGFVVGLTTNIFTVKSWVVMTINALLTAMVIYIILDLDRPKSGLITTKASDKAMTDLRELLMDK